MSKSGSPALKPELPQEPFPVTCTDGVSLDATLFAARGKAHAIVLIGNALGVPQTFYAGLAAFLAERGFTAVTFDYRGMKSSGPGAPPGSKILMEHWGSLDTDAMLAAIRQRFPNSPLLLLGHSAGGQLYGLAGHSTEINGLVLVSSLVPHWRTFGAPWNLLVYLLTRLVIPVSTLGRDAFPARRVGFSSVDIPSGVMRQWAQWARLRHYLWDERSGLDVSRYPHFRFPVLVCHVDDDRYAPWAAIQEMLAHLPATRQQVWTIESRRAPGGKLGHVNFFRESIGGVFWPELAERLRQLAEKAR